MKPVEELCKETTCSNQLQEELRSASDKMPDAFPNKHDCDEGAVEDNVAEAVAGGIPFAVLQK